MWSNDNFFAGICRKNLPQSSKKGNILSKKQVFFGAKISYNNNNNSFISNKLDEIALKSNFKATFLIRTPFLVRPTTYGPPNRNEGIWMDYIFLTNHVGALGGGGEICVDWLVHASSRCSSMKGGNELWEPSNSCNFHFGITYGCRPTQKLWNTLIHTGGNVRVIFPFVKVAYYPIITPPCCTLELSPEGTLTHVFNLL